YVRILAIRVLISGRVQDASYRKHPPVRHRDCDHRRNAIFQPVRGTGDWSGYGRAPRERRLIHESGSSAEPVHGIIVIEKTVTTAHHEIRVHLISEAKPRSDVSEVDASQCAPARRTGTGERHDATRDSRVKIRLPIGYLHSRRVQFVTKTES